MRSRAEEGVKQPAEGASLNDILAPRLPGYEPRPSQQLMAEAVHSVLNSGGRLIVEAATGTGKSFAYLVPLADFAMRDERRAVVSTFTKALQRQLVEKDLPFLRDNLFKGLRFALCLGSENYLCLRRLGQARSYGLFDEAGPEDVEALLKWAARTDTGIREGFKNSLWKDVARESDMCFGRDCREYERCFYQKAKAAERRSHILVTNHHLYFANLAAGHSVLPPFEAAVFDEAHELEDVAADYLGLEVSNFGLRHVFNSIMSTRGKGLLARLKWLPPQDLARASAALNTARAKTEEFFARLSERVAGQSVRIREPGFMEDTLSEHLQRLKLEVEGIREAARDEDEKKELASLARRCEACSEAVRAVLGMRLEGHVYWAERSARALRLAATPVEISGMDVFAPLDSAVFTSAAMSTAGDFSYIRERLGLEGSETLLLRSDFDYRRQAALYIASDLPLPGASGHEEAVTARIRDILQITRGRTLVLFTSYRLLNMAFEGIAIEGLNIARQGDADSYRLLEDFRAGESASIFGTYTFWQGVDVPGEALQCVVITKLPFAVPDEPVVEARIEALQKSGRDPFTHYQVPKAAILLKQGFGRLIRRRTDRGIVAILDPRVLSRSYGRHFLNSLPETAITEDIEGIREFFGARQAQGAI